MRKRIGKVIGAISITLICSFSFFNIVLAEEEVNIKRINENDSRKTYEYDLDIPEISGMTDFKFQGDLNKEIKDGLDKIKEEVRLRSIDDFEYATENKYDIKKYKLNGDYTITNKENILSLTLNLESYIGGMYSIKTQKTYNIDLEKNKLLTLKDVIPQKNIKKIKDEINRNMKSNSKYYKRQVEKNLEDEMNFYIDKSDVFIYFNVNEVGPYTIGVPKFKFSL